MRPSLIVGAILTLGIVIGVTAAVALTREVAYTMTGFFVAAVILTPCTAWVAFHFGMNRGMALYRDIRGGADVVSSTARTVYPQTVAAIPPPPNYMSPKSEEAELVWRNVPVNSVADQDDMPLILGN